MSHLEQLARDGPEILRLSKMGSAVCLRRLASRPDVEFDDLVGEAALAVCRALAGGLLDSQRSPGEVASYLLTTARRAAYRYVRGEIGRNHVEFDPGRPLGRVNPAAPSIVRLREIFEESRLLPQHQQLLKSAGEGSYPVRGSGAERSLAYARKKLRAAHL